MENAVITNEGRALITSVIANNGTLSFTVAKVSDTDYVGQEATLTLGTFTGTFMEKTVSASVQDTTTIKVTTTIRDSGDNHITEAHEIKSVGIVATDGNTTALLLVCTTSNPTTIEPGNDPHEPSRVTVDVSLGVSSTQSITVVGSAAGVLYTSDVVDNLTSTAVNEPLSANMGRVLKENLYKRNLLKNGWFTINEKGQASYSLQDDYTVNDWKMAYAGGAGTVDVTSNGLTLTGSYIYINQPFDATSLIGKQITASILLPDGTVKTGTATWAGADITFYNNNGICVSLLADSTVGFIVYSTSGSPVTFKAAKLELGTESTLANDIAPDKTLELLKCQEADVSGLSNENLLDNGWFTVNQRGATTVTSGLGADRWEFIEGTSATYSSNGVSLNNSFICQVFENQLPNGLYTASVKYQNGTIEHGTAIKADDSTAITFFTSSTGFKLMYTPLAKRFDVNGKNGSTTSIRAVKLELGSKSTLAHDVAPDYTTELLKCQRYFYRVLSNSSSAFIAVGFMADSHTFYGTINLPVPMRGTPTSLFGGVLQIYTTGGTEDVSTLLINMRSPQILTIAATTGNSLTVNSPAILMGVANSYIDISADL